MTYLDKLAKTIKDLNCLRPSELDGLIWNERVKGCFQDKDELKKIIGTAIKNELHYPK